MKGIVRPCRHRLGPELAQRWQAHLCGLCLTLRDTAGQAERALTGYDVLLLSVLVEAQAGELPTTSAGPCPLRAFQPAQVVASSTPAARLAAASALLLGGAGLDDKLGDAEVPRGARRATSAVAARLVRQGRELAARVGLDPSAVLGAPASARAAEADGGSDLDALLAPSGAAVAALFAQTAHVAGVPENAPALARAGDALGRLVHLLDAVEDHEQDLRAGRPGPLARTATPPEQARARADALVAQVRDALASCRLRDPALAEALLGPELQAAVDRALPAPAPVPHVPAPRRGGTGALVATWALLAPAVIVFGGSSGGGCGPRRRPRYGPRRRYGRRPPPGYGYDPYGGYGYGYGPTVQRGVCCGPGCGQLLACNCCANLACNACCCGAH